MSTLTARHVWAQPPAAGASASIQLTVMDARTDARLPYAVVSISALGIERFTDSRGVLTVTNLATGQYDVLVRRLGFLPYRQRLTAGDPPVAVEIRLQRVPQQLTRMNVMAARQCTNPGPPDPVRNADVHTLVSLLRENADRYRLLITQYPFVAMQARALGDLRDSATFLETVDFSRMVLSTSSRYRAGGVVHQEGRDYVMSLPSILELTDDQFARRHCFSFGGVSTAQGAQGAETWYRIDVRADDKLNAPDVHGAFFLDSASAQLRRMNLELSRPDKLPRSLSSVLQVQISTTFAEIASGLSVIDAVCAITRTKPLPPRKKGEAAPAGVVPVELQQLVSYLFTTPPPDVPSTKQFESPVWQSGEMVDRGQVWCAP